MDGTPQHYQFSIDPVALTRRFDALLERHLPTHCPAIVDGNSSSLHRAKAQLIECNAAIAELSRSSRVLSPEDIAQRQQRVSALLDGLGTAKVARLVRRRRRKRQRARELRQQRSNDRERCDRQYEADLLASGQPGVDEDAAPENSELHLPATKRHRTAKPRLRPFEQQNYALLLDRLAELHRIRCQQATTSVNVDFVRELSDLRRLWTE